MTFDFTKEYERLSNEELLKIVHQADQYQPEAVAAAQEILDKRNVTEEEENKVDKHFYNKEAEKNAVAQTKQAAKETVSNSLQEIVNPFKNLNGKPKPVIWLNTFLVAWLGLYLWQLSGDIKTLWYITQSTYDFVFDWFFIYLSLRILFIPLTTVLLYKRTHLGWGLLMFYSILQTSAAIPFILNLFKGSYPSTGTVQVVLIGSAFYALLVYFLLKPEITALFKITRSIKRMVLLNSIIISLIIALLIKM